MNYNSIIKLFRDIATSHKQINSFGVGDDVDAVSSGGDAPLYPRMYVTPHPFKGCVVQQNTVVWTFNVQCFDVVSRDLSNRDEVLSDTNLILQDVIRILREQYAIGNSTLLPFTEKHEDSVYGWSSDLSLETPLGQGVCDVPAE